MPEPTVESSEASPRQERFAIAWAVTLGVLLATTWPLWTPLRTVPRLAPFEWQAAIPVGVDWVFLAIIGFGLVCLLSTRAFPMIAILAATLGLAELMSLDQLRWQPWAYHAVLAGITLGLVPRGRAIGTLRWIAIAVYAFSAFAKLDAEFAATLGQQMLQVVTVGRVDNLSEGARTQLALALPAGELLLAGLLALSARWQQLARPVCVAAVLMHLTTLAVLSPCGLNHSWGVLLWNAGFAWQTVVLFWPSEPIAAPSESASPSLVARAVLLVGVVAPLGTPLGIWDQWPGWALYAPGGERAALLVHSVAVEQLPESLRAHAEAEENADGPWRRVRIDDWVLAETHAPIYPQNRVVAALAVGLFDRGLSTNRVRVVSESAANRLDRNRKTRTLDSASNLDRASRLLGSKPAVVWTGDASGGR